MSNAAVTINITANATGVNAALAAVGNNLRGVSGAAKNTNSELAGAGGIMNNLAGQVVATAAAYLSLAGAVEGVQGMIAMNAEFEDTMQVVRAVTEQNVGFTVQRFNEMGEVARKMGATTRFSATEAAEGLKFLAMSGFTAEQSMTSLEAVLRLAQGSNMELGRAADISSNIMTMFGMKAEEMGRVVDVLARTAAAANTDVEQLGDGMKYVAPLAAGLGRDIEETSAAMGVLSNAGLQASMAGTGLRMVMMGLADQNSKAVKVAARLGLTFDQINPATNSLAVIMERLQTAGFGAMDAMEAFGARGGPAGIVLTQNAEALANYDRQLRLVAGSSQIMAATMDDSLMGAFKNMQSSWEELVLQLGEGGLNQALRGIIDSIQEVFSSLGESGSVKDFGQNLGNAISAGVDSLVGIGKAIGVAVSMLLKITPVLKALVLMWAAKKIAATSAMMSVVAGVSTAKVAMQTLGLGIKIAAMDFKMLQGTGISTFARIKSAAVISYQTMGASAKSAGLAMKMAAIGAKLAFGALIIFMEQISNLLVSLISGGDNLESSMNALAKAQDALATTDANIDFLDDLKTKISEVEDEEGMAGVRKSIEDEIKNLNDAIQKENLEMPNIEDDEKGYEAAQVSLNSLQNALDRVERAKVKLDQLPTFQGQQLGLEEAVAKYTALEDAIIEVSDRRKEAALAGEKTTSYDDELRALNQQLAAMNSSGVLALELARLEAERAKSAQEVADASQEDLEAKGELLKRTKELRDDALENVTDKRIGRMTDEKQIPARLELVGLKSTDSLFSELNALTRKAGVKDGLSEEELGRYEALLETFDQVYALQEKIRESKEKAAENEKERAAARSQIAQDLDMQIKINKAKADGDKDRVAALEKQRAIEQKTLELIEKGFDENQARGMATALVESEDAANVEKSSGDRINSGVIADSLQSIGGGGNFAGVASDPLVVAAQQTAKTNAEIADNTAAALSAPLPQPLIKTAALMPQEKNRTSLPTQQFTPNIGSPVFSLESVSLLRGIFDVLKKISNNKGGVQLRVTTVS